MRAPTVLALALAAFAVAAGGCGGGAQHAAGRGAPVKLTLDAPADLATTEDDTLTVSGSVSPGDADVLVLGRPAEVVGGSFTARVPLRPGANVIDLEASAGDRDPALTAVRVTRQMPVAVPDLSHLTPEDAKARLAHLGLRLRTENDGGLLESILPGTPGVCSQHPDPGTEVRTGTTVTALVAKRC